MNQSVAVGRDATDNAIAAVVKTHATVAYRSLRGTVDMDDLVQIGRITIWKAAESYDGSGTLEGYLHDCLAKRYRDVVRGEKRRRNVFDIHAIVDEITEPPAPSRPDANAMLNALMREYEPSLSTEGYMVLCELVEPAPKTVKAALATNRRRMHLKKAGVAVTGYDTVRLTPKHIAHGTGLTLSQVVRAMQEIKRLVKGDKRVPHLDNINSNEE